MILEEMSVPKAKCSIGLLSKRFGLRAEVRRAEHQLATDNRKAWIAVFRATSVGYIGVLSTEQSERCPAYRECSKAVVEAVVGIGRLKRRYCAENALFCW